jgi:hypothetical protein
VQVLIAQVPIERAPPHLPNTQEVGQRPSALLPPHKVTVTPCPLLVHTQLGCWRHQVPRFEQLPGGYLQWGPAGAVVQRQLHQQQQGMRAVSACMKDLSIW